jgi:ribosomal protein L29
MTQEKLKEILADISLKKKELMMMRIKLSSGEAIMLKSYRELKKEIARLFTQLNDKKVVKS